MKAKATFPRLSLAHFFPCLACTPPHQPPLPRPHSTTTTCRFHCLARITPPPHLPFRSYRLLSFLFASTEDLDIKGFTTGKNPHHSQTSMSSFFFQVLECPHILKGNLKLSNAATASNYVSKSQAELQHPQTKNWFATSIARYARYKAV